MIHAMNHAPSFTYIDEWPVAEAPFDTGVPGASLNAAIARQYQLGQSEADTEPSQRACDGARLACSLNRARDAPEPARLGIPHRLAG